MSHWYVRYMGIKYSLSVSYLPCWTIPRERFSVHLDAPANSDRCMLLKLEYSSSSFTCRRKVHDNYLWQPEQLDLNTNEGFRTTTRVMLDRGGGHDRRGQFCDWKNITGKRDHRLIQPGSRGSDIVRYDKLESWSFDRFSVKWNFGHHQWTYVPFQLNFQGYAGSQCRLYIVTVGSSRRPTARWGLSTGILYDSVL